MHCGTCEEVAIGLGMTESVPSSLSWSSTLVEGEAPKAVNGSFLLEVLCLETGIEVVGEVCCTCSKAPWIWRLRVLAIVGQVVLAEIWDDARVVLIVLGVVLHKSTSIMVGFHVASPLVAASQVSSSSKSKTKASSPVLCPPGQTTHSLHCSNLHASNWWRKPQGFLWGLPSIRMLRCPSLDSGACSTALFIHTKVYSQSRPSSASKTRCWAASARDTRHTWQVCAHTATRPKILLHLVARLGAIKRKAISFLGLSTFPQAPASERAVSWACLMVGTLNCWISWQKLRDPHGAMEVGS